MLYRTVLTAVAIVAALLAQDPRAEEQWITHGPILGRPGARHMGVWARTPRPGTFRVRYGVRPDALDMISPPAMTRLERDNTGWVLIDGLKPDTTYHYVVVTGESETPSSLPGRFRTLPHAGDFRSDRNPKGLFNFSFEFACGNRQSEGSSGPTMPAYRTMLDRVEGEIDFAILNGDWLYEERRDYSVDQWKAQVLLSGKAPPVVEVAPSIVGVWENYKLYLERSANLSEWHRKVPSFFTFDDHEILNDVFGTADVGRRDRRAVFRDIGVQAWFDYLGWSNPPTDTQDIHFGKAELKAGSDVLAGLSQI